MFRAFTRRYSILLCWLLALAVGILIVPVTIQIASRNTTFIPTYIWTEEMARFLFVWMVMIGAMLGVRERTHFEVDMWARPSPRLNAALNLIAGISVLIFALVFVWAGTQFTRFGWNRTSELADLPLWLIHIAWPITGVTWIAFLGEQMVDNLRALLTGKPNDAATPPPQSSSL